MRTSSFTGLRRNWRRNGKEPQPGPGAVRPSIKPLSVHQQLLNRPWLDWAWHQMGLAQKVRVFKTNETCSVVNTVVTLGVGFRLSFNIILSLIQARPRQQGKGMWHPQTLHCVLMLPKSFSHRSWRMRTPRHMSYATWMGWPRNQWRWSIPGRSIAVTGLLNSLRSSRLWPYNPHVHDN